MSGNIATRFAQGKLATKADISALVKATDFSNKLKTINYKSLQIKQNMRLKRNSLI